MAVDSLAADVIVVGGGNAALCAALAAREQGASVLVLERAPEEQRGGNTSFTGGNWRVVHNGVDDMKQLVDLTAEEIANTDFGSYTTDDFFDDMARVTMFRTNPDLCEVIVRNCFDTLVWMRSKGVPFIPNYGRQSVKVDGKEKFWGGIPITISGGGRGLVESLYRAADRAGVSVRYNARVRRLLQRGGTVAGVEISGPKGTEQLYGKAVIVAAGGFSANTEWRTRYLGPGWDLAKVRGSRFNTGDGIQMAIDAGAQAYGNWSGCHATGWERYATDYGELDVFTDFQRHSYPYGLMINANGKRFVDEGADLRPYTYAKYGRTVLEQPGQFCWQVYDAKVAHLLRREYSGRLVTMVESDTLEGLVAKMDDVNKEETLKTILEFNAAVPEQPAFDATIKDGKKAGLAIPKSNWAQKIDTAPFRAYAVTCAITFTFGGIKITPEAEVVDTLDQPIPGLFAAGEVVGGVFYFNYPGGSGLVSGSVFGKRAGTAAAAFTKAA